MRYPRITKVTDLRTGMEHPTRNSAGQFISRREGTAIVETEDKLIKQSECSYWWPVTQRGVGRVAFRFPNGVRIQ